MGKRERKEARLAHGDEVLEARGIDLEAPDEELLPALLGAMGKDPDGDLSIADLLGSIAMEEAARQLTEWEKKDPPDKDLKREIRRSLFRLQQRGIAAARREAAPQEPVRMIERAEPEGYLSPLDGTGSRLAWLTKPRPEGGLLLLWSVINDRSGMRQIDAYLIKKAKLKEIKTDSAEHDAPMVSAPARYVDWLMSSAYKRGAPREEHGGGYPLMRADFYSESVSPVESPLAGMMGEEPPGEDEPLLEGSGRLFEEKEFLGWAVADEWVKLQQARFRDAQDSTVVINQQQMTERLFAIIDQACEDLWQGEARALYAARMGEMALWYLLAGRRETARSCYAVHRALADPTRRLTKAPFLVTLVFKAFLPLMPRGSGEHEEEGKDSAPSLIVRPD